MKVTIITNPKGVENANYILSQAIQSLRDNPKMMESLGLKQIDLHLASTFRKQLIKGFLKR
jgi:hypothetical protein